MTETAPETAPVTASVTAPDTTPALRTIGVVGAGAMGQGIAQVGAAGGLSVLVYDAAEGASASAKKKIHGRLQRMAEKGRLEEDQVAAFDAAIAVAADLQALKDCDVVVEAIVENEEIKRSVFETLEGIVRSDCLLCSNTSSIPIASLARTLTHKGRVAGLHFFNPVPIMKLVEIIKGPETTDETVKSLNALAAIMTRIPVVVADAPGFLVNFGGRAYSTEGNRLSHEGVATPAQVDAIMRDAFGFRMGPFELMDLTGMDVNFPVSEIVCNGYMQDPRLKTTPTHRSLMEAGRLGRKSGQGHFTYDDAGKPVDLPSPDHVPAVEATDTVALAENNDVLTSLCQELGLRAVSDTGSVPILGAPIGEDATHYAVRLGLDPKRLIAIDCLGDRSKRVTIMAAPGANRAIRDQVAAAIIASGRAVTLINDSPGFVGQRMAAMVGNLGCYMAEVGLATPEDIDKAMQLGLNYPRGPLALCGHIGLKNMLKILEELQRLTGEDRYRPTLWLRRRAMLDLPISTPN